MRQWKRLWPCGLCALLLLYSVPPATASAEPEAAERVIFQEPAGTMLAEGEEKAFPFVLPEGAAAYDLTIEYEAVKGKTITPQAALSIGGTAAALERQVIDLPRIWVNGMTGERFDRDTLGNELLPTQVEVTEWQTLRPAAGEGLTLAPGAYTLTLEMVRETVKIRRISLVPVQDRADYAAYKAEHDAAGATDTRGQSLPREAELTDRKSHPEIVISYDRTSPAIHPNDPAQVRYNILGGSGFGAEGQWVSWTFEVPQAGYYLLDFTYRQNISNGLAVRRRLYLDGEVPFAECGCVLFPYTTDFTGMTVGDEEGNPYRFYLEAGTHEIRMEVVLTELKPQLEELTAIVQALNRMYSKIMVIVGETPDLYRDYDLDKNVEGLIGVLTDGSRRLKALGAALDGARGESGSHTARLYEAARMLDTLAEDPRGIPKRLDNFRSQINTLADTLGSMRAQPLELDALALRSPDEAPEAGGVSVLDYLAFRGRAFLHSFFQDYTTVNGTADSAEPLRVWVSANDLAVAGYATGRDQAQIVSQLVTDSFTPQTGIPVSLSLVNASDTLLPAIVSGKGPDAAIFVPKTVFVNLYFRNALVDLTQMDGFGAIRERFYPSAFISLSTGGKTYALPEVQSYNMLFYRSDIFAENGLTPPDTWEAFYAVLAKLQKQGMQIGIAEAPQIYEMFLLQNGGQLYNDDISRTRMTEAPSVEAFTSWTDLYVKYSLPKTFDALNRFRTGQIPLVIANAYFYGQVTVGAPEIADQWAMAPVPGKRREDDRIDRSESCNVSGAIVIGKSARHADAFRFLDWWTSGAIQQRFAFESEARMGVSARYFPANREVLPALAWTAQEQQTLSAQWAFVSDIPQSPATYYVTRNLSNAYRRVVYDYENPRDVIYRYGRMVDAELTRKRSELGLEAAA